MPSARAALLYHNEAIRHLLNNKAYLALHDAHGYVINAADCLKVTLKERYLNYNKENPTFLVEYLIRGGTEIDITYSDVQSARADITKVLSMMKS